MEKSSFILICCFAALAVQPLYATTTGTNSQSEKGTLVTPPPAALPSQVPESPVTGNFDITNNYVFRGVSNSDNNPAVQGGLTYTFLTSGIYLNLWGSSVDFASPQGPTATVEFDTIAGITNSLNDDWSYNLNIDRYNYPRASSSNYNELIGALTYKILTATVAYSSNVYGSHADGTYYNAALLYELPSKYSFGYNNVSLMGSFGHYSLPHDVGLLSYNDYMAGIQKKIDKYTLSLQWTGTNGRNQSAPVDNDHIVGTVLVDL